MYKIAIIGDRESVLGFMALGFAVKEADNSVAAGKILKELADSGEYAVIFIIEEYASKLEELISAYKDVPLPAITVVPNKNGSKGQGIAAVRSAVVRAIGADILFKE